MTRRKTPTPARSAADADQPSITTAVEEEIPFTFESPESSSIARAHYDVVTKQLSIEMCGGDRPTYRFGGIGPQLWIEFYQAESKGKFFAARIRPFYVGVRVS